MANFSGLKGLGQLAHPLRLDPTMAKQLSMADTAILPHAGGKYKAPGYTSPPRPALPPPELPPLKFPEGTPPFAKLPPTLPKEDLAPLVDASIGYNNLWRPRPVAPTKPAGNRIITPGGNKGYSVAVGNRRMQFYGDDASAHAMAGRFKRVAEPAPTSRLNANAIANVGMGASGALAGTALGNAWLNRPGQLQFAPTPRTPAVMNEAPLPIPREPLHTSMTPALSSFMRGAKSLATPTLNQLGY
jgi:hypothetical protein